MPALPSAHQEYHKGRLAQHEMCDAHPELVRAARECSEPAHGRCITPKAELRAIAKRSGDYAAYVFEVWPGLPVDHLARTFVLSPARSA